MAAIALEGAAPELRRHEWLSILGQAARTKRGLLGLSLAGSIVLLAIIGPFVAPYSPTALQPTVNFAHPSSAYWLGTDYLGRDVLSRVLDGGWQLLAMAAIGTLFGLVVGSAAGITSAYRQGKTDTAIMRTVDVILAFPGLVFILVLVSVAGSSAWLITLAVGFSQAPPVARVIRAAALDVSERDFIHAVEIQGVKPRRIMAREIFPNVISPLMVESGLRLTYSILAIAGISFLGFGLPPPTPSWGQMINENRIGITANPWAVMAPALLIAILTIGTCTFTDAIARVTIGIDRRDDDDAAHSIAVLEAGIGAQGE
jgi:peptide/nickel transport system permease protein